MYLKLNPEMKSTVFLSLEKMNEESAKVLVSKNYPIKKKTAHFLKREIVS